MSELEDDTIIFSTLKSFKSFISVPERSVLEPEPAYGRSDLQKLYTQRVEMEEAAERIQAKTSLLHLTQEKQQMELSHKRARIELEKEAHNSCRDLQRQVDLNQDLLMKIRRLEEKEEKSLRSLDEQMEKNRSLKRNVEELQKQEQDKDTKLSETNQMMSDLRDEIRTLNQKLQIQESKFSTQNLEKQALEEQLEMQQKKYQEVYQKYQTLQTSQISSTESEIKIKELKRRLELQEQDSIIVKNMKTEVSRLPELKREIKHLQEENAYLRETQENNSLLKEETEGLRRKLERMEKVQRMDSLDGWVAIKSDIFENRERHNIRFLVQWSEEESKFAVICHNRTLQQRMKRRMKIGEEEEEEEEDSSSESSWAAMFSASELKHIHQQLSGSADALSGFLPELCAFSAPGAWDTLLRRTWQEPEHERDVEAVCVQLERYFSIAVDVCGVRILLETLFSQEEEGGEEDKYCENLQEFRRRAMEEQVRRAKNTLDTILQSHRAAAGLVELMKIYEDEEEAYSELVTVATQFYQHQLQPFRDMRELSTLRTMEIQKMLQLQELGPKRVCELEREADEWSRGANEAVCSIQDITVCYFTETTTVLSGMLKQMEADRKRFGHASWAVATPRLEKLKFLLAKETLQIMRAREMCVNRRKDDIQEKLSGVCDGASVCDVDVLELQYYEAQLELYTCKLEILKNEELLLLAQINSLQRQIKELKEEVVYYDACEDPLELQCVRTDVSPARSTGSSAHSHLQQQLLQLERKRVMISSRRATLRNRKEQCVEAHELQQRAAQQRITQHQQHHAVQQKREKKREEEEKRKEWVQMERERTLSRLRSFRERSQGQFMIKTHRPKKPRPPDLTSNDPDQPLSIITLTTPTQSVNHAPKPKGKGRVQKQRDIPVHILLPPGSGGAEQGQILTPPLQPPPPPPPPLPPPPVAPTPPLAPPLQLSDKEATGIPPAGSGSMDEVLASLQRGRVHLRKVTPTPTAVSAETGNNRDNLLSAIRQGVTLKKTPPPAGPARCHDSELQLSIKAAMMRMKKVSNESDDEERPITPPEEWDS